MDNILYVLLIRPCVHFTFRNSVADAHVHGIVSGLCWHRGRVLLGRPQIFCISNPQTCDRQQSSSRPKTHRRVRNLWTHSLCIVAMNAWFKYGLTDLMTLFFLTSPWLHSVVHWFGPSKSQTSPDPLDSFYSQVPGGKCHEWYEGEGEIWEMSGCYVDFKLF